MNKKKMLEELNKAKAAIQEVWGSNGLFSLPDVEDAVDNAIKLCNE